MKADLVLALGDDVVDAGVGSDVFDCSFSLLRSAGRAGDQQVKIAGGFAAAAQGPGGGNTLDAVEGEQIGCEAIGGIFGFVNAEAARGPAVVFDAFADLLDLFLAHAGQSLEAAGVNGFGELVDAADLACIP